LSDPDKRAFYDKVGRNGMSKVGGEDEQFDPREIFTKLFGGEAFYDYVSELDKRVD
jgi:DnaJ-class molecular chaperone